MTFAVISQKEFSNGKIPQSKAVLRAGLVGETWWEVEGAADGSAKFCSGEWFVQGENRKHGEGGVPFAKTWTVQCGGADDDRKALRCAVKAVQHLFDLHSWVRDVGDEEIGRRAIDGVPDFVAIGKFCEDVITIPKLEHQSEGSPDTVFVVGEVNARGASAALE